MGLESPPPISPMAVAGLLCICAELSRGQMVVLVLLAMSPELMEQGIVMLADSSAGYASVLCNDRKAIVIEREGEKIRK